MYVSVKETGNKWTQFPLKFTYFEFQYADLVLTWGLSVVEVVFDHQVLAYPANKNQYKQSEKKQVHKKAVGGCL